MFSTYIFIRLLHYFPDNLINALFLSLYNVMFYTEFQQIYADSLKSHLFSRDGQITSLLTDKSQKQKVVSGQ